MSISLQSINVKYMCIQFFEFSSYFTTALARLNPFQIQAARLAFPACQRAPSTELDKIVCRHAPRITQARYRRPLARLSNTLEDYTINATPLICLEKQVALDYNWQVSAAVKVIAALPLPDRPGGSICDMRHREVHAELRPRSTLVSQWRQHRNPGQIHSNGEFCSYGLGRILGNSAKLCLWRACYQSLGAKL